MKNEMPLKRNRGANRRVQEAPRVLYEESQLAKRKIVNMTGTVMKKGLNRSKAEALLCSL